MRVQKGKRTPGRSRRRSKGRGFTSEQASLTRSCSAIACARIRKRPAREWLGRGVKIPLESKYRRTGLPARDL